MHYGTSPFANPAAAIAGTRRKNRKENLDDLIDKLLVVDPDKRIGIDEILKHCWFNEEEGEEDVFEMDGVRNGLALDDEDGSVFIDDDEVVVSMNEEAQNKETPPVKKRFQVYKVFRGS